MKTIASILAVACAMPMLAADHFTISGTIPGVTDSIRVTLYNAERNDLEKIVETVTTDGRFSISDTVKMPTLCQLSVARKGRDGRFYRVSAPRIMVENTDMTVNFTQPLDSLGNSYVPENLMDVKGGVAQSQFADYLNACGGAELKSLLAGYKNAEKWFETNDNPDTMAVYDRLKDEAASELLKARRDYIASHPDYHISSVLTFKELQNIFTYTDAELDAMAEQVKVCPDTARVSLNNRALAWSKQYSLDRRYPDFAVDDTDGEAKQFSTYVTPGKYTFIDFWASWCGPCRAAIPHVRKLREHYGDKMNIYSISCDENEAAWRKAMEQEKMEWTQLRLNPSQLAEAGKLYAISAIPRLILLDQHGRIVCSTNLPKEIDAYLESNMK